MGSFSWIRAEDGTRYMNICSSNHVGFRLLVPKAFREQFGENIKVDEYMDYGQIMYNGIVYDMYGLLAKFNKDFLDSSVHQYKDVKGTIEYNGMVCDNETFTNRNIGIEIGMSAKNAVFLRYVLKLVSLSSDSTYEKCKGFSVTDPEQGFIQTHWDDSPATKKLHNYCKKYWTIREEYERRLDRGLPPVTAFTTKPRTDIHNDLRKQVLELERERTNS